MNIVKYLKKHNIKIAEFAEIIGTNHLYLMEVLVGEKEIDEKLKIRIIKVTNGELDDLSIMNYYTHHLQEGDYKKFNKLKREYKIRNKEIAFALNISEMGVSKKLNGKVTISKAEIAKIEAIFVKREKQH